jgi:hypothetical protein
MKSIIVLGCSQNQIKYLKLLKQKFKIILLDKNKKSPGKNYAHLFFQYAYDDLIKLNYLLKKKLYMLIIFLQHHLIIHLLDWLFSKKIKIKKISIPKINFNYIE